MCHGVPVAAPHVLQGRKVENVGFFDDELRMAVVIEPDLASIDLARVEAERLKDRFIVPYIARSFIDGLNNRSIRSMGSSSPIGAQQ
jgi:hypothetical protein